VIAEGDAPGECDLQVPLLSLPLAFNTTLETIPSGVPYLKATREKVERWAPRLKRGDRKPKVGIACAGQSAQKDDRQRSMALERFAGLEHLAHLFLVPPALKSEDRRYLRESARPSNTSGRGRRLR
jgi:hypothetical protein